MTSREIHEAELIEQFEKTEVAKLLRDCFSDVLNSIRKEVEKPECTNRDYLAGKAAGVQQYELLITKLIQKGEEARRINKEE